MTVKTQVDGKVVRLLLGPVGPAEMAIIDMLLKAGSHTVRVVDVKEPNSTDGWPSPTGAAIITLTPTS